MILGAAIPDAPRFTGSLIPVDGEGILSGWFEHYWWTAHGKMDANWGRQHDWVDRWQESESRLLLEMDEATL